MRGEMFTRHLAGWAGAWAVLLGLQAQGQVPNLVSYQGKLTDAGGTALNGPVKITFAVYATASGGTSLWSEIRNPVYVTNGVFQVLLGSSTSLPADLFDGADRWLGVKVKADAEMTPRTRIASVPYALRAGEAAADTDWTESGGNVFRLNGKVGVGTPSPAYLLHVLNRFGLAQVKVQSLGEKADLLLDAANGNPTVEFQKSGAYRGAVGYDTTKNYLFLYEDGSVVVQNGQIGLGTNAPRSKLDVIGTITVDQRIQAGDSGGIDLASSDGAVRLQVNKSGSNGILRVDDRIQAKDSGGLAFATDDYTVRMQIADSGNVGIGTTTPAHKLEVSGDVKVTGACYGTFPRPAYDSGWQTMAQDETRTLTHSLGGSVDNYVVDMQFKGSSTGTVQNTWMGGDHYYSAYYDDYRNQGGYYTGLTTTQVKIHRMNKDFDAALIRLRIWTYK